MILERPARDGSVPVAGLASRPGQGRQILCGDGAIALHLRQDGVEIGRTVAELSQRVVFADSVFLATMREQRPAVGGHDRRLVRPLLREFSRAVGKSLEPFPVIGAEARPEHQEMGGHEHVHVVELEDAGRTQHAPKMAGVGPASRAGPVETLRRERHSSRFGCRQAYPAHVPAAGPARRAAVPPPPCRLVPTGVCRQSRCSRQSECRRANATRPCSQYR